MTEQFNEQEYTDKIKELKKQVQSMQQQNVAKVNALAQAGRSVNGEFIANLKVDVFIKMFLDDLAQLKYVLELETRLQEELNEGLKQLRTESLQVNTKNLIIPK